MKFICETITVWQANIQVIGEKRAVSVIQLFSVAHWPQDGSLVKRVFPKLENVYMQF